MKSLRNIMVLLLACMVFVLGAGAGVVHICSKYCETQICSSSLHEHETDGCCHNMEEILIHSGYSVNKHCSCVNIIYSIDFFKISQDDISHDFVPLVTDVLESVSVVVSPVLIQLLDYKVTNAPPFYKEGRTLLALNSTLLI